MIHTHTNPTSKLLKALVMCGVCILFGIVALWHFPAFAQSVTLDPQGSGAISGALAWMQGTLLGSVATAVAVTSVASVGLLMLTGRMNWRFGATVILGLFILFGAGAIVSGIRNAAQNVQ